jgi:hypothetical protein
VSGREPALQIAEQVLRQSRDLLQLVDRAVTAGPIAVGDHTLRLRDREVEAAEVLEGRRVDVDRLRGRLVAGLLGREDAVDET